MIHLNFTIKEMQDALERIGYTVKLENIDYDTSYMGIDDVPFKRQTYMVYYGDQCLTDGPKFARQYDVARLEEIFTLELKNFLINGVASKSELFASPKQMKVFVKRY